MENQKLLERLNNLWAFLEEEGYYTKSNTVYFALKYIEGLEKEIKDLRELAGPTLCKQHDLRNAFMKERTPTLIDTIDSETFTHDPGKGIECGKMDAPERIWVDDERSIGGELNVFTDPPVKEAENFVVKYIRSDLSKADVKALEDKLAKAVKALRRIASNEFAGVMLTSLPPQDAAAHFARATLAELTGDLT